MTNPPQVLRLSAFADLGQAELNVLIDMAGPTRQFQRHDYIQTEGEATSAVHLLLSGWTASSVTFLGGAKRILKVHMPGDLLGLPSLALTQAADSIFALSTSVVLTMPLPALGHLFEASPRLAALLFLVSQEERVILMDRLASMCCCSVVERVAALILQFHARLCRSDPDTGNSFHLPLTQHDVADLAGATPVHINRSLQHLRADGLISWVKHEVTILDHPGLQQLAGVPRRHLIHEPAWIPRQADPVSASKAAAG